MEDDVDLIVALPSDPGSRLQYELAAYSLNGTFQGLVPLTDQLQLCNGAKSPNDYAEDLHNYDTFHGLVPLTDQLQLCNGNSPNYYAEDLRDFYVCGACVMTSHVAAL